MTYLVNENCIKCKHMDCVEVCPVDCFYEGENMLVINPDECIDCGVCEPECPVDAIITDAQDTGNRWLDINTEYSNKWPNIAVKDISDVPEDAEDWADVPDKFNKHFSPKPGGSSD
tara:strand:- start:118 stop:465 length:348 start_codon:yes stop_codon:yes gene_type:complete